MRRCSVADGSACPQHLPTVHLINMPVSEQLLKRIAMDQTVPAQASKRIHGSQLASDSCQRVA